MIELDGPSRLPRTGPVRQVVALLHGVGADGSDLIDLAPMLAPALPGTAFHAPDAPFPCDMAPYGRQWFSLLDRRPAAMLAGIEASAPLLDAWLDAILGRHAIGPERLALLGFSQGCMMALHVGPRRAMAPAAVVGFSGALLDGQRLRTELRSRPPVLLVHGEADEVVPFGALAQAETGLRAAGIEVEAMARAGLGHAIDPEGIDAAARFLARAFALD